MVFIDGTNVLVELENAGLSLLSFYALGRHAVGEGQLKRVYVYSTQQKIDAAKADHGAACFDKCRVVLGDSITTVNGYVREKWVDALLVADLICHAAMKNFGYRWSSQETHVPPRLIDACDDYRLIERADLHNVRFCG